MSPRMFARDTHVLAFSLMFCRLLSSPSCYLIFRLENENIQRQLIWQKNRSRQSPTSGPVRRPTSARQGQRQAPAGEHRCIRQANGYQLVDEYYDAAVSGADAIEERPGFSALLDRIDSNGVRTVIVEDASRFAREMKPYVLGVALLRERGVRLLTSNGSDLTDNTDEMQEGLLQIMAVFAQIEKRRLVKKLAAARKRKREATGKCEGRKSLAELQPDAVALARRLRRRRPKGGQRSLREISAELAAAGYVNERGKPYNPKSVASMVA